MHKHSLTIIALVFFALQFYSGAQFDLSGEEAYYWTWSQEWNIGYWHHPPIVAYGIGIASLVFGNVAIAVRIIGIVLQITSAWLLAKSTQKPQQTFLLISTIPALATSGIEANPNIYLFSFLSFFFSILSALSSR